MTSDELREKVAKALTDSVKHRWDDLIPEARDNMRRHADAAIAVVLEEAARTMLSQRARWWPDEAAAAIRALISSSASGS